MRQKRLDRHCGMFVLHFIEDVLFAKVQAKYSNGVLYSVAGYIYPRGMLSQSPRAARALEHLDAESPDTHIISSTIK